LSSLTPFSPGCNCPCSGNQRLGNIGILPFSLLIQEKRGHLMPGKASENSELDDSSSCFEANGRSGDFSIMALSSCRSTISHRPTETVIEMLY
jgi:hypothetical protein